jgi:hypothetical protein
MVLVKSGFIIIWIGIWIWPIIAVKLSWFNCALDLDLDLDLADNNRKT